VIVLSAILIYLSLRLLHKRKIKEEFTLLWIGIGLIFILFILKYNLLLWLTKLTGAEYPASFLFFAGITFLLFSFLYLSHKTSTLIENQKKINQLLGIILFEIEKIKKIINEKKNDEKK
jgi:hypothetical protein